MFFGFSKLRSSADDNLACMLIVEMNKLGV